MKKSLLLAALLFSSFHILGQSESVLTVFSEFGEKFTLILNGEVMNDEPNNRVTSTGLTQSIYMAAVKFEDESMGVLRQKNLRTKDFDENPVHITYVLTVNRKGERKLKVLQKWTF